MTEGADLAIAPEVLIGIAQLALEEIDGVRPVQPTQRVGELLTGRRTKGIAIERDDSGVWIDITVAVDYGIEVPKVAATIQKTVREAVASMTGLKVKSVNIFVDAVDLSEVESSD